MTTYLEVTDAVDFEETEFIALLVTDFLAFSPNPTPNPTETCKMSIAAAKIQYFFLGTRIVESEDNFDGWISFQTSLTTSGKTVS